jgi:hypothetical protein
MALGAGVLRDVTGSYDAAWFVGGGLCVLAGGLSLLVRRPAVSRRGQGRPAAPRSAL